MQPAASFNPPQQPATECTIQAPTEKLETLSVDLAERSYPIYIGKGILSNCEEASNILRKHIKGKSCMVVTNTTVGPLYLQQLVDALSLDGTLRIETVVLPDGEQYKTLETMNLIFDALLEAKLDRKTTLIALGGGVIGDITGYAAASYMRGVNFVQVPTTLLAMVDSSVGGKTGVNHRLGKNMIGAFYQPQCVVADVATLDTLPDRELKAGIAEVIKYGLINDLPFFEWLEQNIEKLLRKEAEPMTLAIKRSCERKADIVKQDERESTGMRALLNLGHTFGHAVENNLGYGEWLHGEAVAAGTCMAAALSRDLAWISDSDLERVVSLTARAGLPTEPPKKLSVSTFLKTMAVDKKVADGQLRLVLMKNLGTSIMTADFTRDSLVAVVERYLPTQ